MESCCLICSNDIEYFFSKVYPEYPGCNFKDQLKIDYHKCKRCGFVISKTHQEMSAQEWEHLNYSWHHYYESNPEENLTNQPPYINQALAIALLMKNKLIHTSDVIDYAAGYGSLAQALLKYFNIKISIFDKYVKNENKELTYINESELSKKFKLVINSAMFEHVLHRTDLNRVNDLVSEDGVLMIHTVVCERIPNDPKWFYLEPLVHTAFHTNNSMSRLMHDWGYSASIYCPQAKSWYLYKKNSPLLKNIESTVKDINRELQTEYFIYKNDFVDYWKGF